MTIVHGNFSGLAKKYSQYRPGYSEHVLTQILSKLNKPASELHLADIGAGTGIWTRMLAKLSPAEISAVEPNEDMRSEGIRDSTNTSIRWNAGSAENTGLPSNTFDCVTMASSFHWANFEKATLEFNRILKSNGAFVALWNPRDMKRNPLLQEIENYLVELKPDLKRVSSGSSEFVEQLAEKLGDTKIFGKAEYFEDTHIKKMTSAQYIEVWRSTNDVPHQLGEKKFEEFLRFAESALNNIDTIDVVYLTRAWMVQKISI